MLKEATGLFIATDADREGELIARQLIEYFG
ncbi:DNA topoisomerase III [Pseudomonas syringae pv. actinidiae ICMP 19099]|nr:DNA topoisomerase III [Pseudomonas syringae pv. actinidiae ICMP 19098]EPN19742.1 DNA topoisomerase III [Pseudomonas syringae pv. actinidiae ICMP 19100]EPN29323.1 DNA topoisomerase III [Pseudomonas syringae pv. actinidiae ICMP 19099]EPN35613.1 DNA topoisomerase III [Pseudomonas syringae pv. actinidiae ICMP 18883]EPN42125.1 DNA topoisomerase III [Pseudomonas syringae pv. actinidiae ICMP 19095]EPN51963.1 DNA topoisomerase III [Pseudomonas syringae pv. actinidiae ICMP 19094]